MRQDPRCPSCDGKVSATADWCMHCGREFDAPVDANADGGGEVTIATDRASTGGMSSRHDTKAPGTDSSARFGAEDARATANPVGRFAPDADASPGPRVVAPLVSFLAASQARQWAFAGGVALGVLAFLLQSVVGSAQSFVVAITLGAYLATRKTAQDVLASSASVSGLVVVGVLFVTLGSPLSLSGPRGTVVVPALHLLMAGLGLVIVGRLLRR